MKATAVLFSLVSFTVAGQKIYFPLSSSINKDLEELMPQVAKDVERMYRKEVVKDSATYYSFLFRLQMIEGDYAGALKTINLLRSSVADSTIRSSNAFPFYIYCKTKSLRGDFRKDFEETFIKEFQSLSFKNANAAENYFKADLDVRQGNYLGWVARLKASTSDSLSYADAKSLCFAFLNYRVYGDELQLARLALRKIADEKYIIEDSVLIPMRDGAKISATIVRSRKATAEPVILKFGIYAVASAVSDAKTFADRGYAGVVADTRGKRLSTESIEPFEHDSHDAYDIIDWISKQSWCNGKVAMYGGSYLGFVQWAAAKKVHPALKTIVPMAAVAIGVDFPYLNGVYWSYMLQWFHLVGNNKLQDHAGSSDAKWNKITSAWFRTGRPFGKLDSIEGSPNRTFQKFIQHPQLDHYWQQMAPYKRDFAQINIPVLTITGYYDDDQRGAIYYFNQHSQYNKKAEHYLLIGPYDHYQAQEESARKVMGFEVDRSAQIDLNELAFAWYDYILKGKPRPSILKDKVNYQVMGADKWAHAPTLKSMSNDTLVLYLTDRKAQIGYELSTSRDEPKNSISQTVNLMNRASENNQSSINGEGNILIDSLGKGEYITFATKPVETGFEINGSFAVNLKFVTNKLDIDLAINLYEQLEDGKYLQLSNNIARISSTTDPEHRKLITPGKPYNFNFSNTFITSRLIRRGSRIVIAIGVNKNHLWQINCGSGKDVSAETINDCAIPFNIQWLTGQSCIKLPIKK